MVLIHPVVVAVATLCAGFALAFGLVRLAARHFGARGQFPWKRHVLAGRVALWGLLAGAAGGMAVTWLAWGSPGVTGAHAVLAAATVPLAGFGLASGAFLAGGQGRRDPALAGSDRLGVGQGRRDLALAHGLNNMLVVGLLALQAWLGVQVLLDFVL